MATKGVGGSRSKTANNGNAAVHPAHEHPSSAGARPGFIEAFKGDCELINARWDLESGRTVDFRIAGDGFDRLHPFKRFQRKRGGRVGTRFAAAICDSHGEVRVNTEVMLKGWTESATGGQQFSLWLDNETALHPFAGCQHRKREEPGEMFRLVLMELLDDESQAPQEGAIKVRKISNDAHLLSTSGMFVRFLKETRGGIANWDNVLSKQFVKSKLEIESLSELDRDKNKAKAYEEKILKPYERWRGGH